MPVAPNLLARDFTATRPNRAWTGNVTDVANEEGWPYLAAVMDMLSRCIIGWSMKTVIDRSLVIDALEMACLQRRPESGKAIFHSDRGSQYASQDYATVMKMYGVTASMSRRANYLDNAVTETLFLMIFRSVFIDILLCDPAQFTGKCQIKYQLSQLIIKARNTTIDESLPPLADRCTRPFQPRRNLRVGNSIRGPQHQSGSPTNACERLCEDAEDCSSSRFAELSSREGLGCPIDMSRHNRYKLPIAGYFWDTTVDHLYDCSQLAYRVGHSGGGSFNFLSETAGLSPSDSLIQTEWTAC